MSVQRLAPSDDGSGNLELVDSVWEDSSGTAYANAAEPLPNGALPGITPAAASVANHAVLDALQSDIALALGSGNFASATAGQIVSDLEGRVDANLGVSS